MYMILKIASAFMRCAAFGAKVIDICFKVDFTKMSSDIRLELNKSIAN